MIDIINLNKSFGKTNILKNISLKLPDKGIVVIYGPSGCGKTTLLNCISGLLPFDGNIQVDSVSIGNLNDKELSNFRLRNYGFIFQDYKLFENESVQENILFPLRTISNLSREKLLRKCNDLIELIDLNIDFKTPVKKLSGGEKQRVAIARSLVNDPKIVLADEPTGALDYQNGRKVMEILTKISFSALVIIVSHDKELCDEYADEVIELKDGQVKNVSLFEKNKEVSILPIFKNDSLKSKQSIPTDFLLSHSIHSLKERKWRTMFCNAVTSLGLIGVGLAISLSSSISDSIKDSYASLLKNSSIIISLPPTAKSIYGQYSGGYYEALNIANEFNEYVAGVGVDYIADFENFFPTRNNLVLADLPIYKPIEGISIRNVNEFDWIDYSNETFYPRKPKTLLDDQIVLGLTIDMIQEICFNLKIERTVTSLSKYILNNDVHVYFDVENDSWEYSDQQIFTVVGFTLVKNPTIYHSNRLWNQYVYEECMRFPTLDNLVDSPQTPWYMKKIPYLFIKENRDEFLAKVQTSEIGDPFIFEIANASYYPWKYLTSNIEDINRIIFLSNTIAHIPNRYVDYFCKLSENLKEPIFANTSGYSAYPNNMIIGFSRPLYFCKSEDKLSQTLEEGEMLEIGLNDQTVLDDDILIGHYSKSLSFGVNFKSFAGILKDGREALDYDEIVVSSGMLNKMRCALSDTIYVAYTTGQRSLDSGKIINDYKTTKIKIVGVVEDEGINLYHNSFWTIGFFQSKLGISSFNLQTTSIIYDLKNDNLIETTIKDIKKGFPEYEVVNPLGDINKSVDEVCGYIALALMAFSSIAVMISTILLSISNYLHILEARREIALTRCLGVSKEQSRKFSLFYSLILCLLSFGLSSIELVFVSLISSFEISKSLSGSGLISFNPLSIVAMLLLSLFISTISSLIISTKINKLNPIEAMKQ